MKKHIAKISIIFTIALFFFAFFTVVFTYFYPVQAPLFRWSGGFLPAAKVDSSYVLFRDVYQNAEATRTYNEALVRDGLGARYDYSTDDGKKRLKVIERQVLNKLIENKVVEGLVDGVDRRVSAEEVTMELERSLGSGDPQIAAQNARRYGWTLDEFAEKVIQPTLYQKRLLDLFEAQNGATDEQVARAEAARKMVEDGRTFEEAALEYSDAPSADEGGYEGFFEREQLYPDLQEGVFALEVGALSDILETPIGLHVFLLDDERVASDGTRTMVAVNHILIAKESFGAYLQDQMSERSVSVFVSGYVWDTENNIALFRDPELAAFEQKEFVEAMQEVVDDVRQEAEEASMVQDEGDAQFDAEVSQ